MRSPLIDAILRSLLVNSDCNSPSPFLSYPLFPFSHLRRAVAIAEPENMSDAATSEPAGVAISSFSAATSSTAPLTASHPATSTPAPTVILHRPVSTNPSSSPAVSAPSSVCSTAATSTRMLKPACRRSLPKADLWALRATLAEGDPDAVANSFNWSNVSSATDEESDDDAAVAPGQNARSLAEALLRTENAELRREVARLKKEYHDALITVQRGNREKERLGRQFEVKLASMKASMTSKVAANDRMAHEKVKNAIKEQRRLEWEMERLKNSEEQSRRQLQNIECARCKRQHVAHCHCCTARPSPPPQRSAGVPVSPRRKTRTSPGGFKKRSFRLGKKLNRATAQNVFPAVNAAPPPQSGQHVDEDVFGTIAGPALLGEAPSTLPRILLVPPPMVVEEELVPFESPLNSGWSTVVPALDAVMADGEFEAVVEVPAPMDVEVADATDNELMAIEPDLFNGSPVVAQQDALFRPETPDLELGSLFPNPDDLEPTSYPAAPEITEEVAQVTVHIRNLSIEDLEQVTQEPGLVDQWQGAPEFQEGMGVAAGCQGQLWEEEVAGDPAAEAAREARQMEMEREAREEACRVLWAANELARQLEFAQAARVNEEREHSMRQQAERAAQEMERQALKQDAALPDYEDEFAAAADELLNAVRDAWEDGQMNIFGAPPLDAASGPSEDNGHGDDATSDGGETVEETVATDKPEFSAVPETDSTHPDGLTPTWVATLARARCNSRDDKKTIVEAARNQDPYAQVALIHLALPFDGSANKNDFPFYALRQLVDATDLLREAVLTMGRRAAVGDESYAATALREMSRQGHVLAGELLRQGTGAAAPTTPDTPPTTPPTTPPASPSPPRPPATPLPRSTSALGILQRFQAQRGLPPFTVLGSPPQPQRRTRPRDEDEEEAANQGRSSDSSDSSGSPGSTRQFTPMKRSRRNKGD